MKNPKVSVIIPTFNEEKNIIACVDSLMLQSYKPLEIFIIDDGSTDQTQLLLDELNTVYPTLKLFNQKHQGPGIARNLIAQKSGGEILVFLDADMTFEKDFIRDLIDPIIEGKFKGTFSKEEFVGNWENVWARSWNYNQNRPDKKMHLDNITDEGTDFRAILKSEFLRVGGFDDTGYTDTWTLLKKLGYKPHLANGAKYFHKNPDNLKEVFSQSKWAAKREYKLGKMGKLIALVRVSFPVSLLVGIFKAVKYQEASFIFFKLIFDLGAFLGILEMVLTGKKYK